jgi:hypothetical protein
VPLVAGALLAVAAQASAAGWTAPAAIPAGSGPAPIARPAIGADSAGVIVAAWRRGRGVHVTARYVGGPWAPPRRVAVAGDATSPRLVSTGAVVALAVVEGAGRRVRLLRWSRGLTPAVDGPRGGGARDLRPAALAGSEVVAVYERGGSVVWSARPFWSARPRSGPWTAPAVLFPGAASASLARDRRQAVLATALRPTSRGTVVVAALRRPGAPFGPRTAIRPLGPRWTIASAIGAIRPDGRTAVLLATRGRSGRGALLATVAGARQRPVRVSAAGVAIAGPAGVVVREAGGLVAVWRQVEAGGARLFAAREAGADGSTWEAPVALTRAGRVGAPALATARDGRVILVYAAGGAIRVRTLAPPGAPGGWSAARTISGRHSGCASPSIAFDADRTAIVAFSCAGGRRLLTVSER